MQETVTIPSPVMWFEGMPLLPHHFQQEFAYSQHVINLQFQCTSPYNYGVLNLEIDLIALTKNIFKLNTILAIMPDGAIIQTYAEQNILKLEYNLPKPEDFEADFLSIYLVIPKMIANNYFTGKYPRYIEDRKIDIIDIVSGQDPVEMKKILPNCTLMSDLDLNPNYTFLKISELVYDKNIWSLKPYIPACMNVIQENQLHIICSQLTYFMRKKIQHLKTLIDAKSVQSGLNFISESLLYIQGISAGLPFLEGLLLSQRSHPFQLYLALCNILGNLSILSENLIPTSPVKYDHQDILNIFENLKEDIESTINSVVDEKYDQIYFKKLDNKFHSELLKDSSVEKGIILGFKKKIDCSEVDFINWINNSIFCDTSKIEITLENRTLGYDRIFLERTEDIIPTRGVFLVKITSDFIKSGVRKISIFNCDNTVHEPEDIFLFLRKNS